MNDSAADATGRRLRARRLRAPRGRSMNRARKKRRSSRGVEAEACPRPPPRGKRAGAHVIQLRPHDGRRPRNLWLSLWRLHDDHRRGHRSRERVALPVHGGHVRRRRVRPLLRPHLHRHRRAGAHGRVRAGPARAARPGRRVCRRRLSVRRVRRMVLLRGGRRRHRLLHRRDRVGALLRGLAAGARGGGRDQRRRGSAAGQRLQWRVVRAADGLHRRRSRSRAPS